ncbi:BLOC-1-related complex subunit 7-like isoform X2 [Dreissena polymorpha]|uniref:BLOC-1-related complex subunit 7-like isoform X2 n=1 Tax=Dreissena polymorpha TaxID=45954 RepID=UPI002264630B|nr:BLOC-1-related complex subunit 7-like isoform X2 [Dreissena polymorpha]
MYSSSWNQETKLKLNDKVSASVNDMGSLIRHVVRSSKSPEMLGQAARNFCSQEHYIQNSSETLMKMGLIKAQFEFQLLLYKHHQHGCRRLRMFRPF